MLSWFEEERESCAKAHVEDIRHSQAEHRAGLNAA